MFKKWIVPTVFLIGAIIFLYPIASNWLSDKEHHTVISEHNEVLHQMTEDEKKQEAKKAEEHNESLQESAIPITDPFSDEVEETTTGYYDVLNIGETMGSVEIPSLNINLPIYHGVGEDVLQQGVGHMSNSSFPVGGLGTHTALTAHRGLPSSKLFRDLDKVNKDDLFFIHTLGETMAYKVDDIKVVLPTETNWLGMHEDKDYVTLITCEPYMINTHRLLVRGERIPYQEEMAEWSKEPAKAPSIFPYYLFILSFLAIIIIIVIYFRRKSRLDV